MNIFIIPLLTFFTKRVNTNTIVLCHVSKEVGNLTWRDHAMAFDWSWYAATGLVQHMEQKMYSICLHVYIPLRK